MAKKPAFSFDDLVDTDSEPDAPVGVVQRGAAVAPVLDAPAAKRGRPSKGRSTSDPRPSFALDPETHAAFKIWLLQNRISMQDYLENHIKSLVRTEN